MNVHAAPPFKAPAIDHGGPVERPFDPVPDEVLGRPLFEVVAERAWRHPTATAVHDDAVSLTYGELIGLSLALADAILAHVARGTPVAILLPNCAAAPVALLGAFAAGTPAAPLDIDNPPQRLADMLRHAGAGAVIVDSRTAVPADIAPDLPRIDLATLSAPAAADPTRPHIRPTGPDEVGLIVYTSGSTGIPKGIAHGGRLLLRGAQRVVNGMHVDAADRVLQLFAPSVQRSMQETFGAFLAGAVLDVVDIKRQGLQEIARAARERGATIIDTLPQVFRALLRVDHPPGTFDTVRIVALGGDKLFDSDVALFRRSFSPRAFLYSHLGSSETDKYAHRFIGAADPVEAGVLAAGHLVPGTSVRLEDEAGHPVPQGEAGAVVLESTLLALGYWRDPERTQATFEPAGDGARRFRIGDRARFEADGRLNFLGRDDRVVKVRGNRVDVTEVEAALRSHPGVTDLAIVARAADGDAALVAYVVPQAGQELRAADLLARAAERLPAFMHPAEIHFRDRLPTLPSLKLDMLALEAEDRASCAARQAEAPEAARPDAEPAQDVEAAARAAWTSLLPAETWTRGDTWQDAGGDSLKAMELVMRLERALGRAVPVTVLLPGSHPEDLVHALRDHAGTSGQSAAGGAVLFFLPGAAGPLMDQAAFARRVADVADVRILDYPPIDIADPKVVPIPATVDAVLAQIAAQDPGGPVRLAGYSYGGYIAVEVAARLVAQGRRLAFLCLVDTPAPPRTGEDTGVTAADAHLATRFAEVNSSIGPVKRVLNWIGRVYMAGAYALVRHGWLKPLAAAIRPLGNLGRGRAGLFLWWHVTHMTRRSSVIGHVPSRVPGRIWLLRVKDEPGLSTPVDHDWGRCCDEVPVSYIEGLHDEVFAPANAHSLETALRAALAGAERFARAEAPS